MTTPMTPDLPNIWQEVSRWPPGQRLALATRILQSLQQEATVPVSKERSEALTGLIGIWKTEHAPNDEEVRKILAEDRLRKYG